MSPKRTLKKMKSSLSVSTLKEKTRRGLKRLTSRGVVKSGSPTTAASTAKSYSPAVRNPRARSDENTPVRSNVRKTKPRSARKSNDRTPNPKETESPARIRMARRRVPVSMASALQEVKGNLTKAVENVSTKLKMTRRRSVRKTLYDPLVGDTPVKMYSPFSIETPDSVQGKRAARSSRRSAGNTPNFKKGTQTTRKLLLDTPTGKFRQDLEDVTRGFEELNSVTRSIRDRSRQEHNQF
ncbi:uncharacterized protein LOC100906387 [Galendromus occidentalis]|uniref:Uncharacterized protein LOC100906387 n=1 Tax=Galendromus occidentalis TaxID=34638 RepID=A0AAJ6VUT8_9ACAR|nr:uncharacterized protein LOC100906387 [Galendromus occidentalis]